MKKILKEYIKKRHRTAKMEMSIVLFPNLLEKSGILSFKDGAANFSSQILRDENTMFCILDLMPVCSSEDYYLNILVSEYL